MRKVTLTKKQIEIIKLFLAEVRDIDLVEGVFISAYKDLFGHLCIHIDTVLNHVRSVNDDECEDYDYMCQKFYHILNLYFKNSLMNNLYFYHSIWYNQSIASTYPNGISGNTALVNGYILYDRSGLLNQFVSEVGEYIGSDESFTTITNVQDITNSKNNNKNYTV